MGEVEHKILDWLQHLQFYIGGLFTIVSAGIGLWWHDKKTVKKRIKTLESIAVEMATKDDLRACRDGVDKQDDDNLKVVLNEIQAIRDDNRKDSVINSQQHQDILHQMTQLHSK